MKNAMQCMVNQHVAGIMCATWLLVPLAQGATDAPESYDLPRHYGWAELGAAMVPEFNGTLSYVDGSGPAGEDLTLKMSPGFMVNGGFGERFLPWLSGELLGGFYYGGVDEAKAADGQTRSFNASLLQVPILLNAIVHLPDRKRVVPFVGAGAGAMVSWLDIDDRVSLGDLGVVPLGESSTQVTFAYQAFAGVRFNIRRDGALALTYRFSGAGSPNWALKDSVTGDTAATLKARDIFVHSLTLGFYTKF